MCVLCTSFTVCLCVLCGFDHRLTWYGTRGSRKIGRVPCGALGPLSPTSQKATQRRRRRRLLAPLHCFCSSNRYCPRSRLCHSRMSGVAQLHDDAIASASGSGSSSPQTLPDLERPPRSGEHSRHSGGLDARHTQPEYHDDENTGMMVEDGDHDFPPRPTAPARPRPVPQGLRSASQMFRRRRPEEIRYMAKAERIKTRDELWKRGIVVVALILSWCEWHSRTYDNPHVLTAPTLAGSLLLYADLRLQQMDVSQGASRRLCSL